MTKKSLNVAIVSTQIVIFILMLLEQFSWYKYFEKQIMGYGHISNGKKFYMNFFRFFSYQGERWVYVLAIVLMCVNILICIVEIFENEKTSKLLQKKYWLLIPLLESAFIIVMLGISNGYKVDRLGGYNRAELGIICYIVMVLLVISALISVYKHFGKLKETSVKISSKESISSNTDELKKYKELLDDGVITQEEFDAKKKQLLGL